MVAGTVTYTRQVQSQPSALVEAKSRIGGLGYKVDSIEFVNTVSDWVLGARMENDLIKPEVQDLVLDELPTDGVPVADNDDDEPIVVE
jgi:hypothetical protein